jgi:hypothetical protein
MNQLQRTNKNFPTILGLLGFLIVNFSGFDIWSALGIGLTIYVVLNTIDKIGETLPIIDLMTSMMTLQWVLGPFIEFRNETPHYKYHMYVDEPTYMSFIVPAILAFMAGTALFKTAQSLDELGKRVNHLLDQYPSFLTYSLQAALFRPT